MTVYDGSTPLPTLLSGEIPSATKWATILDALHGLTDARSSYTPVWSSSGTAPVLNNGTISGLYRQSNKYAAVLINLAIGSGTTFGTGAYRFSLPVTPVADQVITAFINDASASQRLAGGAWIISAAATGDNMRIVFSGESPFTNMTGTSPITLATGDRVIICGVFEVA